MKREFASRAEQRRFEQQQKVASHTPGPWDIAEFHGKIDGAAIWAGGMLIAQVAGLAPFDEANARLIAAAPELLEVLKQIVKAGPQEGLTTILQLNRLEKASAAIGKAEGRVTP